jgi:hypothetical protein
MLPPSFLVLLLGVGLWAWSAGLDGPYLFDDFVTPLDDPASQSFAAWRQNLPVTLRPLETLICRGGRCRHRSRPRRAPHRLPAAHGRGRGDAERTDRPSRP